MKKTILLLMLALCTSVINAQEKKKPAPASTKPVPQQKEVAPVSPSKDSQPDTRAKETKNGSRPSQVLEPNNDVAMAAMTDYMKPGRFHELLTKTTGEWKEVIEMWSSPDAEPMRYEAVCTVTMLYGGLYQETVHRGNFNGMEFNGRGLVGYDNALEKYVSTWMDNMGSGIMYSEGTYNSELQSITFMGEMVDPVLKQKVKVREIVVPKNDNEQVFEMYVTPPGGREYKSMQIVMSR